jgi:hypothetical protein
MSSCDDETYRKKMAIYKYALSRPNTLCHSRERTNTDTHDCVCLLHGPDPASSPIHGTVIMVDATRACGDSLPTHHATNVCARCMNFPRVNRGAVHHGCMPMQQVCLPACMVTPRCAWPDELDCDCTASCHIVAIHGQLHVHMHSTRTHTHVLTCPALARSNTHAHALQWGRPWSAVRDVLCRVIQEEVVVQQAVRHVPRLWVSACDVRECRWSV